jgi:hypothetical protein
MSIYYFQYAHLFLFYKFTFIVVYIFKLFVIVHIYYILFDGKMYHMEMHVYIPYNTWKCEIFSQLINCSHAIII